MKIKCIALLLACLLVMLTACQPAGPRFAEKTPPQNRETYRFDSYEELVGWLKEEKNTEKTVEEWGADYIDYVKEVNTPSKNDTPLYIPYINGEPAKTSWISFQTYGGGYVPWVVYTIDVGGESFFSISCACLSQKDFARVDVQRALDAVRNFDPKFPNLDDCESGSYSDPYIYEFIFEETIQFSGKSISALHISTWQGPRVEKLYFAFDKTLVIIEGSVELLTNRDFIASISLQKAELP